MERMAATIAAPLLVVYAERFGDIRESHLEEVAKVAVTMAREITRQASIE